MLDRIVLTRHENKSIYLYAYLTYVNKYTWEYVDFSLESYLTSLQLTEGYIIGLIFYLSANILYIIFVSKFRVLIRKWHMHANH